MFYHSMLRFSQCSVPMSCFISRLVLLACATLLAIGCASKPQPVYRSEAFGVESPFMTWIARDPGGACELGKRALLSQGYQVDDANATRVRGEKFFRPAPDSGVTLSITLVCLASNLGSVVYANGLETRYELKSSSSSTALSVAGIGGISLPWSADKEALVKVGEETISDADFYKRLFGLIEGLASGFAPAAETDATAQ